MDDVSTEQHHKIHIKKSSFRDLEIPPRKLLTRQQNVDSPIILPEEKLLHKFLPSNSSHDDDESDPYASDEFRMYEFKIRKCTRSRSHDWTACPFAHPGEKARRRCPRRFNYSGTVCADFRRGSCTRGDVCEFAHGVFECWLHPSRYRTEACKDGKTCQRKICFFAHSPSQLRSLTLPSQHCAYCRCGSKIHHTNSPTSVLDVDSSGGSPISRFSEKKGLINRNEIKELMNSMRAMSMNEMDQELLFAFCPSGSGRVSEERFVNEGSTSGPDFEWVNDLLT
ncbi:zinc finger CCCH domain-containing protein 61-like [Rutidosis leptorrhynchoides]|uniref:zinc finger CCCH domain-containing protein 61-like n=1 Tax=Rutidosis leptorrhynchoides TaxID=125765 RepID=UPI003A997686